MQSWEAMPANNYEHNWFGNVPIKNETQELNPPYPSSSMDTSPAISPQSNAEHDGTFMDANAQRALGFNPLTPPSYPVDIVSQSYHKQVQIRSYPNQPTLTPSHTPPIDVTPPKSPKPRDGTPDKDESTSMDSCDENRSFESDFDDEGIKIVKINSHGKMKKYKCKQCEYVAVTKLDFWEHTKAHMKPEKMLKCPKCPFVTEYKHHLEYHLRNHDGTKPFQCPNCNYSCVNKSMLNSHLKSHSNIYQYRCKDCQYATKYCHSLKLHLRKYTHKPAMVLNSDGTPNPLPIIDVYGTRRGPKTKSNKQIHHLISANENGKKKSHKNARQTPPIIKSEMMMNDQMPITSNSPALSPSSSNRGQLPNIISSMLPNTLVANMLQSGTSHMFPYLNINFRMLAAQQQQQQQAANNIPSIHDIDIENIMQQQRLQQQYQQFQQQSKHLEQHHNNNNLEPKINNLVLDMSHGGHNEIITNKKMCDDNNYESSEDTDHNIGNDGDDEDEEIIELNSQTGTPSSKAVTSTSTTMSTNMPTPNTTGSKNRRKGKAFKLDVMKDFSESDEDNERKSDVIRIESATTTSIINDTTPPPSSSSSNLSTVSTQTPYDMMLSSIPKEAQSEIYECKHCDILFKHPVLHSIHMGYHGFHDVFNCNMCGKKSNDCTEFFLHVATSAHQKF